MIVAVLGTSIGVLVALYMMRPPVKRETLSAARFFADLPQVQMSPRGRFRPGQILTAPLFYLRLLVLLLLLLAVWFAQAEAAASASGNIGLWLFVDTSASMTTRQAGGERIQAAQAAAAETVARAVKITRDGEWCVRLSTFDLVVSDTLETGDPGAVGREIDAIRPRALGTDLGMVQRAMSSPQRADNSSCNITTVVVITDRPAPLWATEGRTPNAPALIWHDISQVTTNTGFTNIQAVRDLLTGRVREVLLEVTVFGPPAGQTTLEIRGPGNELVRQEELDWSNARIWQGRFSPLERGRYQLALSPGGTYGYDDVAVIDIEEAESVRVDWRLDDPGLPNLLGWRQDDQTPQIRVATALVPGSSVPTLIVGPGYNGEPHKVGDFDEASPLLADVNFDVAELVSIPNVALPDGFRPVLRADDGATWLAVRDDPPAAYTPGLPISGDDNTAFFSQTVFFNAVRWLLGQREFPAPYTTTTPEMPNPEGSRLALHTDEGNTALEPHSAGSLDEIRPATSGAARDPLWPRWLAAGLILLMLERMAAVLRGHRWS